MGLAGGHRLSISGVDTLEYINLFIVLYNNDDDGRTLMIA